MKHSQKPAKELLTCKACRDGDCGGCVDVARSVIFDDRICTCKRQNHLGEPVEKQVKDPFTDHIYGPNAVIKEDGSVTTDEEFKEMWRGQFGDTP